MDTRRFRRSSPSDAVAAFRWLGWVMLMMFVLVQTAHADGSGTTTKPRATRPQARELSQASVQFDPGIHSGSAAKRTLTLPAIRGS